MGNQTTSCCNLASSRHLDELCFLTTRNLNASCQLSFNPWGNTCCSTDSHHHQKQLDNGFKDLDVSEVLEGPQTLEPCLMKAQESTGAAEHNGVELMTLQQKNQTVSEKILKNKPIKKSPKPQKTKTPMVAQIEAVELMNPEEVGNYQNSTTIVEDGIRDQNNCKCYHKLVKNYLIQKGLDHLFDDYGVEYHTRYYFTVALIFIKYYLKQDFNEVYKQIVQKELEAQSRKIQRRQAAKDKLDRELVLKGSRSKKELEKAKTALEMKIHHIRVVIHEIEDYSLRSCLAFFSGNTEESLRILYMKDDPVMRKKYYFDSALELVNKIQNEVRQVTSRLI